MISFISLLAYKKKAVHIQPIAIDKKITNMIEKIPIICFAMSAIATPIR